jgi:hypothetical protein
MFSASKVLIKYLLAYFRGTEKILDTEKLQGCKQKAEIA